MTAFLNPRFWIGLALVAVLAWSHGFAYKAGRVNVRAQWDKERAELVAAALAAEQTARTKEQSLQAEADTNLKAKNAQIAKLNRGLAAALDGLRDRKNRPDPGSVPAVAGTGGGQPGCTGAGLFRDDSALLTRLAYDADNLRAGLQACQTQYQAARRALMPLR